MYLAPAFSPVSSVRAVNAITCPLSFADRKHHPLAKAIVDRPRLTVALFLALNSPLARSVSASAIAAQPFSQRVKAIRRIADAETS